MTFMPRDYNYQPIKWNELSIKGKILFIILCITLCGIFGIGLIQLIKIILGGI